MTDSEQAAASAGVEPETRELDLGRCFQDAVDFFKPNFLILTIAALATQVVIVVTLTILAGPLIAGWVKMVTNGWHRSDRKVQLGDLFGAFDRLPGAIGLFYLYFGLVLAGSLLLVIPGIVAAVCLTFAFYLFQNHGLGAIDSVKESFRIVFPRHLLWLFVLLLVMVGIQILVALIPVIRIVLGWIALGFFWGLSYSAYLQLVVEPGVAPAPAAAAAPPPEPPTGEPPPSEAPTA